MFRFVVLKSFLVISFLIFPIFSKAQSLVIVVHKDNPTTFISDKDLESYFLKTKTVWNHGLNVLPVSWLVGSLENKIFLEKVLKKDQKDFLEFWQQRQKQNGIVQPLSVMSKQQMIAVLAFDVTAIGYVFEKDLTQNDLKKVKVLRKI